MSPGIIVDDTVHIFSKYLRVRCEQGISSQGSVRCSFITVGKELLFTSSILILGFLVLDWIGSTSPLFYLDNFKKSF